MGFPDRSADRCNFSISQCETEDVGCRDVKEEVVVGIPDQNIFHSNRTSHIILPSDGLRCGQCMARHDAAIHVRFESPPKMHCACNHMPVVIARCRCEIEGSASHIGHAPVPVVFPRLQCKLFIADLDLHDRGMRSSMFHGEEFHQRHQRQSPGADHIQSR